MLTKEQFRYFMGLCTGIGFTMLLVHWPSALIMLLFVGAVEYQKYKE